MSGARVLTWTGNVGDVAALTADEDEGLRQALASLRAGNGRTIAQVRQRIDAVLRR